MSKIFVSCAKGGCIKEAELTCNKCKFMFCGIHLKNHMLKGVCSIKNEA